MGIDENLLLIEWRWHLWWWTVSNGRAEAWLDGQSTLHVWHAWTGCCQSSWKVPPRHQSAFSVL